MIIDELNKLVGGHLSDKHGYTYRQPCRPWYNVLSIPWSGWLPMANAGCIGHTYQWQRYFPAVSGQRCRCHRRPIKPFSPTKPYFIYHLDRHFLNRLLINVLCLIYFDIQSLNRTNHLIKIVKYICKLKICMGAYISSEKYSNKYACMYIILLIMYITRAWKQLCQSENSVIFDLLPGRV